MNREEAKALAKIMEEDYQIDTSLASHWESHHDRADEELWEVGLWKNGDILSSIGNPEKWELFKQLARHLVQMEDILHVEQDAEKLQKRTSLLNEQIMRINERT
jgi:hypothetical protein